MAEKYEDVFEGIETPRGENSEIQSRHSSRSRHSLRDLEVPPPLPPNNPIDANIIINDLNLDAHNMSQRQSRANSVARSIRSVHSHLSDRPPTRDPRFGPLYDNPELQYLCKRIKDLPGGNMVLNVFGHQLGQDVMDVDTFRDVGNDWILKERKKCNKLISKILCIGKENNILS